MLWKNAGRAAVAAILILVAAAPAWAADLGFAATVGLEITYTPIPPASYNIGSDLELVFNVPGFTLQSNTGFDLAGFAFERVALVIDLGAAQIEEDIRFEPNFDWNEVSLDVSIVGVQIGVDWIFANTGSAQTPSYSMAAVVALESEMPFGLGIASVTGFGATDVVNVVGGAEAPLVHEMLFLFDYVDTVCTPAEEPDVTVVDGFFFEEELLRLTLLYSGMAASHTMWFDASGLSQMVFELGYVFPDPALAILTAITLDGGFSVTTIDIVVDALVDAVRFTSWTGFAEPTFPIPLPVLFSGQKFAVSFELSGVHVTSETDFDDLFLFAAETIVIEATIDPVTFVSLTTFDSGGFAGECIQASVAFSGVKLSTAAQFTWDGVVLVSFGFELSF
jgi:hypothetical protein